MAGKQRLSTSCIYIPVSKVKWVIPEEKEASLPKQYCHIGTRVSGMIRRGLDLFSFTSASCGNPGILSYRLELFVHFFHRTCCSYSKTE
jgi:hypothetical protein